MLVPVVGMSGGKYIGNCKVATETTRDVLHLIEDLEEVLWIQLFGHERPIYSRNGELSCRVCDKMLVVTLPGPYASQKVHVTGQHPERILSELENYSFYLAKLGLVLKIDP